MTPALAKELVEALEKLVAASEATRRPAPFALPGTRPRSDGHREGLECLKHGLFYGGYCAACLHEMQHHYDGKGSLAALDYRDGMERAAKGARAVLARAKAETGTREAEAAEVSLPMAREQIFAAIAAELDRAYAKHGRGQWGRHEFYGVLAEEFDELWDAIKRDEPMERVVAELVQVAAMCVRYAENGDRYGFVSKKPKIAGPQEFEVTDDGHGRAMVGGRRLASGGAGMSTGTEPGTEPRPFGTWIRTGARVRVELREGTDFATLMEVL